MPNGWITLIVEVWTIILASLSKSDLKRLSEVSKYFHALVIPILYRVIDLSIHHHLEKIHIDDPRVFRIHAQQFLFVNQVLLKPRYGSYVQSFTWTMSLHMRRLLPDPITGKKVIWTVEDTYRMFAFLHRARHIDLDTGGRHFEPVSILPSLFPNATSIRLGGRMHFALATAILHGVNKAPLTSLSLHDVQEGGLRSDGANFYHGFPYKRVDYANIKEIWPKDSLPVQVVPGSMRRLLTPSLQSRCQHLRYLFLRKQGQQHSTQGQLYPYSPGPSFLGYEDDVYKEWASFLRATRPKVIIFEHGGLMTPRLNPNLYLYAFVNPPEHSEEDDEFAPMDKRFRHIMLPVLKDGWPGLERVEVRGVSIKVLTELQKLEGVEVVIDEKLKTVIMD